MSKLLDLSTEGLGLLPPSPMPPRGHRVKANLRGPVRATPPSLKVSTKVLGTAYPFLAESGTALTGPYIGENTLSRSAFSYDQWDAYKAGFVRSHSTVILGVKGSGKSMLAKSWSSRLIRCGRKTAVPHDPNGEWVRVAEYVGGKSIAIGPGKQAKINLLDVGPQVDSWGPEAWRHHLVQIRRSTLRAVLALLDPDRGLTGEEHTALDTALERLGGDPQATVPHVYAELGGIAEGHGDVAVAARRLWHLLRRIVSGDLAGLFDGPSTVTFDTDVPMMVVDTSAMKNTSKTTQALARLATSNWIRQATTGSNRTPRAIIHEEAAVELLNMVAAGEGLTDQVAGEKVARHDGVSNWYLFHRIADLNALGDAGSATRAQALGLIADCDTRVTYAQHAAEIPETARHLGWNDTEADLVRKLGKGEGLWQIGDRTAPALVKNICTPGEMQVFRTDTHGGARA